MTRTYHIARNGISKIKHYTRAVHNFLIDILQNQWIEQRIPVEWPQFFPDLNLYPSFLWKYLTSKVYWIIPAYRWLTGEKWKWYSEHYTTMLFKMFFLILFYKINFVFLPCTITISKYLRTPGDKRKTTHWLSFSGKGNHTNFRYLLEGY